LYEWLLLPLFKGEHLGRLVIVEHVLVLLYLMGHLSIHLWALIPMVGILDAMVFPMHGVNAMSLKVGSLLVLTSCGRSITVCDSVSEALCGSVRALHAV